MITTTLKWYSIEEKKPEPDISIQVIDRNGVILEVSCDEENIWRTAEGYVLNPDYEIWMWADFSYPMLSCGEIILPETEETIIEIHVRGGVAYPPDKLPDGVRVKIIDHDRR